MRLRLTLEARDRDVLALPRQYNELIQGFLYRHLDRWLAQALHDGGLPDPENRRRGLRLFTFSRLLPVPPHGRWRFPPDKSRAEEEIVFEGPVQLLIASPLQPFLHSLLEHLLRRRRLRLGRQEVRLLDAAIEPPPSYESPMRVEALSPITVYRTLYTAEGKRKTYYFTPFEDEFEELLLQNLKRKLRVWRAWQALFAAPTSEAGEGTEELETRREWIRPLRVSPRDEHVVLYKGTVIKAWTGVYELDLPPELFQMAFDAGLGVKNSQGFGCIGVWQPSSPRARGDRNKNRGKKGERRKP